MYAMRNQSQTSEQLGKEIFISNYEHKLVKNRLNKAYPFYNEL